MVDLDRLAVLGSTLGQAVTLQRAPRDQESTRVASSIAGVALDYASEEARRSLQADLERNNELGSGELQFPQWPWVLWENERVFELLRSADVGVDAEALRQIPLHQFILLTPAMLFAAVGAPHRAVRLPRWALFLVGTAAVATAGVALHAMATKGDRWHV